MDSLSSAPDLTSSPLTLSLRQIRHEAIGIKSYELVDQDGRDLPPFTAGSHIDVHLDAGMIRQYSLCNDPAERHRYVIAVLREEAGRGGSRWLQDQLRVEDRIRVSRPRNLFTLQPDAKRTLLLGGGIGITPLKAMAHHLDRLNADYSLHYCAKSPSHAAFREEIRGERVQHHYDGGDPAAGLDIGALLQDPAPGEHLYYCGPPGFMQACAAGSAHWPAGTVHSEHFKAPTGPTPADDTSSCLEIASTGQRLAMPPGRSIVEILQEAGIVIETSCVSGLCGTCKIGYLAGEVDHQDFILSEDERRHCLTSCVSRPSHGLLVLDL